MASTSVEVSKPLHIQAVENALRLEPLLDFITSMVEQESDGDSTTEDEVDLDGPSYLDEQGVRIYSGIAVSKTERKADKTRLYNFSKVKKSRKWLKNVLLSDSSSNEDDESRPGISNPVTQEDLKDMLKIHTYEKQCRTEFYKDPENHQYAYYGTGLLSNYDRFYDNQTEVVGPKKKIAKEQKKMLKAKLKKLKQEGKGDLSLEQLQAHVKDEFPDIKLQSLQKMLGSTPMPKEKKVKKLTQEQLANRRRRLWVALSKKEIPRAAKQKASARKEMQTNLKKVSKEAFKECRRNALVSQKIMKEAPLRARRLSKEMQVYWKRFDKVEKDARKKAEKEAQEQRKMDIEAKELKRQQRKFNFLITQTELYAHFMSRKITGEGEAECDDIMARLDEDDAPVVKERGVTGGILKDIETDHYDPEKAKDLVLSNAQRALDIHQQSKETFDREIASKVQRTADEESTFAHPTMSKSALEYPQPAILQGTLKGYQLKGMNWLANLYDQGINGILADEMGLGKTVQSIAFLAYLAEVQSIWGPFLIVAPASTLHNWQQEMDKFVPQFKVVPYWGTTQDRKVLRKFWNQDHLHSPDASFHVVITSYQLVIQDVKFFQRIRWHYLVLDEAQAIKSSSSARWKILLGFSCRNRLLLTGTPIQNTMGELWALLHFIMPTLFDSHDEFNEWFSKDIESHAERQSGLDEKHLSRLHMILKPFMLRRVKKDVENELSDKIEILVYCPLTIRQRALYQAIKNKIRLEDLKILSTTSQGSQPSAQTSTSSLMNLVMQFRKVCNHPELFERREARSPFYIKPITYILPKLLYREGLLDNSFPSQKHILYNKLYIFHPHNVHSSLFTESGSSCFSFTRFIDLSPAEIFAIVFLGLLYRWKAIISRREQSYHIRHQHDWQIEFPTQTSHLNNKSFLLEPVRTIHYSNRHRCCNLNTLVFTSHTSSVYSHITHVFHYIPETVAHCKIRQRRQLAIHAKEGLKSPIHAKEGVKSPIHAKEGVKSPTHKSPSKSPSKTPTSPTHKSTALLELTPHPHKHRPDKTLEYMPTEIPAFLYYKLENAHSRSMNVYCQDRSAEWGKIRSNLCGTLEARNTLYYGDQDLAWQARYNKWYFNPSKPGGMFGVQPKHGFSNVYILDKETLVTDAGKLYVLDNLLERLKREGHRVLIYSQMTRMIDLLEEYMWHRKHTYMRLDGSSKISDRRDMVADFQTRSDIFVFLLSTRAGGLGINLTAADTVIFYDSDWNPTVDQQAMDRAHRLGQTKQVTVYRLICKGTIEERILQRAKEKSEIQKIVISGGNLRPDVLRPKEVVSLLLDDDELENKLKQKAEDKQSLGDDLFFRERKRKSKTGRGPGRPKKKKEENTTIPAVSSVQSIVDTESNFSFDSPSVPASPASGLSIGSEIPHIGGAMIDDSSNDALVIVDDAQTPTPTASTPTTSTPTGKKKRGRPKGSGGGPGSVGRRSRGRGSHKKAMAAAEAAAAAAGKSAAYAAYGYSFESASTTESPVGGALPKTKSDQSAVGGATSKGGANSTRGGTSPKGRGSPKGSPRGGHTGGKGFYTQR